MLASSQKSFGFPTAPGADDDASGTALVLAVARLIHSYNLKFARKLGELADSSRLFRGSVTSLQTSKTLGD